MPPATTSTSLPPALLHRPTATKWAAKAECVAGSQSKERTCDVAHLTNSVQQWLTRERASADRDCRLSRSRQVEHVELPRLEGKCLSDRLVYKLQFKCLSVGSVLRNRSNADDVRRPHIRSHRGWRSHGGCHAGDSRMAATSSVKSIPTGHQVMQRPQPTQPDVSNWSCQVASLCVIHCRYRERTSLRTSPPFT